MRVPARGSSVSAHLVPSGPAAGVPPLQERQTPVSAWPGLGASGEAYWTGKSSS